MLPLACGELFAFSVAVDLAVINIRTRRCIYRYCENIPAVLNSNSYNASLEISASHILNNRVIIPVVASVDRAPAASAEECGRRHVSVAFPEHRVRINSAIKFFVRFKESIHRRHQ